MSRSATLQPPHVLRAVHHRGENLVVILATAEVSRDAVRQLLSGGAWVRFQKSHRRHDEAGHTERALEALLVEDSLLYWMERAVRARKTFNGLNFLRAHGVREHRA